MSFPLFSELVFFLLLDFLFSVSILSISSSLSLPLLLTLSLFCNSSVSHCSEKRYFFFFGDVFRVLFSVWRCLLARLAGPGHTSGDAILNKQITNLECL